MKGAEKILFGLDDIAGQREVVIVEGEMDKLALEQAGEALRRQRVCSSHGLFMCTSLPPTAATETRYDKVRQTTL